MTRQSESSDDGMDPQRGHSSVVGSEDSIDDEDQGRIQERAQALEANLAELVGFGCFTCFDDNVTLLQRGMIRGCERERVERLSLLCLATYFLLDHSFVTS